VTGTFGGCATCVGECCRRYVVPVSVVDVRAIVQATALHPAEFLALRALAPAVPVPGFRLEPGGPEAMVVLDRRSGGACTFLLELPGGQARCGAYGHRPLACRAFPTTLRHGTAAVRRDVVCGPDAWSTATMDLAAYHADLTAQRLAWAEHGRIAVAWNEVVDSTGVRRSGAQLMSHLLTAGDSAGV
jgi:Fe-S-cluster containining protein